MFVKICGITTRAALDAAVEAGADALGFVFAPSPREIAPERAAALCEALPPSIVRVAVMRDAEPALWARVAAAFEPDWLQTDAADFAALALPERCRALPVYRNAVPAGPAPARLLFEGAASGAGHTANWDQARALARRTEVVLAGGLTEANLAAAIRHVRPWGVDVSSGVERRRGEKDPALIKAFVARARAQLEEAR